MFVARYMPRFAWSSLEDRPSLRTLKDLLASIPDAKLLQGLQHQQGQAHNDFPARVLWGVLILRIALRHGDFEATLERLGHNAQLRRMIGIEDESRVPQAWNIERFLDRLGQEPHLAELRRIFGQMVQSLSAAVPDLGQYLTGDSTSLKAPGGRDRQAIAEEECDGLAGPSAGRKEYTDDDGNVVKIFEWFGYKLHLLVDAKHEVALSYQVTSPGGSDGDNLQILLSTGRQNLPAGRIRTLTYNKAVDTGDLRAVLAKEEIRPLIQIRSWWKDQTEQWLPCHDGTSNIVFDEAGTLHCYDRSTTPSVRHPMAYVGYEPRWDTITYLCPAQHEGWNCPHNAVCNAARPQGKTICVARDIDLRRSQPVGRTTRTFERMYHRHTCPERVNARLKIFWGADDGNIAGVRRFHGFIGTVMIVHLAFATHLGRIARREGALSRRWLRPVADALAGAP